MSGFSFGATSAPAAANSGGFSFGGNSATSTSGQPQGTGLTFGTPAAATTAAAPGFNLGGAPASTTSTGLSFGAAGSNQPKSLSFGNPAASSASFGAPATTSTFSFGAPATTAAPSSFSFGAPAASGALAPASSGTGINFGVPAYSASSTFGGFGASSAATSTAPTLSFGANTAKPSGSLSFGAPTASSASASTSFSLSVPGTSSATFQGLGGTNTIPSQSLGFGMSTLTSQSGLGSTSLQSSFATSKSLKETQLHPDLVQTVEEFKKFVKEEKNLSSDIAHASSREQQKIANHINNLSKLLKTVSSGLAKNKRQLDKLKMDAAQELLNAEIAQHTRDTPPTMQYENYAPTEYFNNLIRSFANQMQYYQRQIEETEQHLQSLAVNQILTSDDVSKAISKLQSALTTLAAKYQTIHEGVQQLKKNFITQNRDKYGVAVEDLFPKRTNPVHLSSKTNSNLSTSYVGPSPFATQDLLSLARASSDSRAGGQGIITHGYNPVTPWQGQVQSGANSLSLKPLSSLNQNAANPTGNSLFNMSTPGILGNSMSPFGSASNQSSIFQSGGKRGKH